MSFYERVSGVKLRRWIEQESGELGFGLFGVVAVDPSAHLDFYRAWIKNGTQGEMAYLARTDAIARRGDHLYRFLFRNVTIQTGNCYKPALPFIFFEKCFQNCSSTESGTVEEGSKDTRHIRSS